MCMKKIMVDIFSVYPDISFDNKKSEKITEISELSFGAQRERVVLIPCGQFPTLRTFRRAMAENFTCV